MLFWTLCGTSNRMVNLHEPASHHDFRFRMIFGKMCIGETGFSEMGIQQNGNLANWEFGDMGEKYWKCSISACSKKLHLTECSLKFLGDVPLRKSCPALLIGIHDSHGSHGWILHALWTPTIVYIQVKIRFSVALRLVTELILKFVCINTIPL